MDYHRQFSVSNFQIYVRTNYETSLFFTNKVLGSCIRFQEWNNKLGSDRFRVLTLVKNLGKGGAVRRGVLVARGRRILFADADGATTFSELDKLMKALPGERFQLIQYLGYSPFELRNKISKLLDSS